MFDALFTLVVLGLIPVTLALAAAATLPWRRRTRQRWRDLAVAHGLALTPGRDWHPPEITGHVDGLGVRVSVVGTGSSRATRWEATGAATKLRAAPEEAFLNLFASMDLQVGDPAFDNEVRIDGDPTDLLARLDAPTRALLLRFIRAGGVLFDDAAVLSAPGVASEPAVLEVALREVLTVARALRESIGDPVVRLGVVASTDPLPAVRAAAFARLLSAHREHPSTEEAAAALRDDPDHDLSATARLALGDVALAQELALREGASVALRLAALSLVASATPRDLADALRATSSSRDASVACAGLRQLALAIDSLEIDEVRELLEGVSTRYAAADPRERNEITLAALEVAEALSQGVDERWLMARASEDDGEAAAWAARLLGGVGTVQAVASLRRVAETASMFDLRREAASEAVASILAREDPT